MSINLDRIGWQDGTLVSKAKVEVNGVIYDVEPEQYSGQTPLSSANLKKMEENTEKAINEVDTELNNKITNLTTYSTNEIKTGKFWNDGKPIYRKTLIYTNKEIANGTIIAHSIQNINEVTDFEVRFNDNGTLYTFPFIYEGTGSKMYVRCNKTSIVFQSDGALTLSGKTTRKLRVTIEYTKTTD